MLYYNFTRVFKLRGIDYPYAFLINAGFSSLLASRMRRNELKTVRTSTLERICLVLNCTPNDVLEWKPSDIYKNDNQHALNEIRAKDEEQLQEISDLLHDIPLNKLEEVKAFIAKQKEKDS